jgi:hypothetical protein
MVHHTVLFSVRFAAPLLIIPILFAIVMNCITSRSQVGKALYENNSFDEVKKHSQDEDQRTINPTALSIDASIQSSRSLAINQIRSPSDGASGHGFLAIDACFYLMIVFIMQFWTLLFFDMIAHILTCTA